MSDIISNLADAYDVELNIYFDIKEIVMTAKHYDTKTKRAYSYNIKYAECIYFEMNYTEEETCDVWDLTDGIEEVTSPKPGIRVFNINFAGDDVILKIKCRKFTMTRIDDIAL